MKFFFLLRLFTMKFPLHKDILYDEDMNFQKRAQFHCLYSTNVPKPLLFPIKSSSEISQGVEEWCLIFNCKGNC